MEIVFLIAGILIGIAITWLFFKSRKQDSSQLDVLQNSVNTLEKEIVKYEAGKSYYEEQIVALKIENLSFTSENKDLLASLNVSETNLQNLKEKLDTQKMELEQLQKKLVLEFENLANRILDDKSKSFSELNKKQIDAILNPFNENLKEFKTTVKDTYEKGLKERSELGAELKIIQELNMKLSAEASNLTKALKGDVQKQGRWGEMILEKILESSGLEKGNQYKTQDSFSIEEGRRLRPDAVIYLPEGKHIIIDSKVSLVAYEKLVNADNEDDRRKYTKEHILSVRNHIKELADKDYVANLGLETPEYLLMFIPVEASLAVAVSNDTLIFNEAWDRRIVIVSPSTLIATLMTVNAIWKQTNQTQNALLIADRGGKLYEKFVGFVEDMNRIGIAIDKASKEYGYAMSKLSTGAGNLVKQTEDLKKLGAKTTKSMSKEILIQADSDADLFLPESTD
jgi:DNA recombination protein RmuC